MTDSTVTVRLSREWKDRLEALGRVQKRSKSFLAGEALKAFIESEEQYVEGVKAAQAEIRAGRGLSHDEVMAELDRVLSAPENLR